MSINDPTTPTKRKLKLEISALKAEAQVRDLTMARDGLQAEVNRLRVQMQNDENLIFHVEEEGSPNMFDQHMRGSGSSLETSPNK